MYAGARDFTFIRIGTSGGIGVEPGTVVITQEAVDGRLRPQYDTIILGKVVSRPTTFRQELCERVHAVAGSVRVAYGKTMVRQRQRRAVPFIRSYAQLRVLRRAAMTFTRARAGSTAPCASTPRRTSLRF